MTLLLALALVVGIVLLVGGAELLVRGASRLAIAAGISPLVVGLTVVAYGTSAPELFVAVTAAWYRPAVESPADPGDDAPSAQSQGNDASRGADDLIIGNVVGSNISNILLVLGIAAVLYPLSVSKGVVWLSVPAMIGFSLLPLVLGYWDGVLGRLDGALLLVLAVTYTVQAIWRSLREGRSRRAIREEDAEKTESPAGRRDALIQCGLIAGGAILLASGAYALIYSATEIAQAMGVSDLVIGLTVVAVGTSLPELATTIIATVRGQRDLAVGNAVGSNIFNVLLVLGGAALVSPDGISIDKSALVFDLPVMVLVGVVCLPIFFTGYRISRWEGVFFLTSYGAYLLHLFLKETKHDQLENFERVMLYFALPITVVTLIALTLQTVRRRWPRRK